MAQHDMNIANQGFPAVRSDLNNALSAIQTNHSGTSRPTGAVAGQIWLDTTSATSPTLKFFDGSDDISLATIDYSANTVNFLDSAVSVTGLSTSASGTVLTLSDSATTQTVDFIVDNQKEIRFSEADSNGSNYIALKSPASVGSNVTFTLPSADGSADQVLKTDGSGALSFTNVSGGTSWQSSVKTANFTAVSGEGYFVNTSGGAFEIDLPTSPSVGDEIEFVDFSRSFATNNLTLDQGSNKFQSEVASTKKPVFDVNGQSTCIVYSGSTQGWIPKTDDDVDKLTNPTVTTNFLVLAGGGSGAEDLGGGGGAGGLRSSMTATGGGGSVESALALTPGQAYTVTVGAGYPASDNNPGSGSNSSISGSGITTITSLGGGEGGGHTGYGSTADAGQAGGCGGGSRGTNAGGAGTANQGFAGGTGVGNAGSGGGGTASVGADASSNNGGNGGAGASNSITGSAVEYGGGGGGGVTNGNSVGSGGAGGGGAGSNSQGTKGTDGSANLGGGGGGGGNSTNSDISAGGSGVVILRLPTAQYTSTTSGSPTVTTDGSDTVIKFTGSGSYTA